MTWTSRTLALACLAAGCRGAPHEPLAPASPAPGPPPVRSPLASLGLEAGAKASDIVHRVDFTGGQRERLVNDMSPFVRRLATVARQEPVWEGPRGLAEARDYEPGLRLVTRALVWETEDAVKAGDYARAADNTLVAYRLAMHLSRIDAASASLGEVVADGARAALVPVIGAVPPERLAALHQGLARLLQSPFPTALPYEREKQNALVGVQYIQDLFAAKDYDAISDSFGIDVRPAVAHLRGLPSADAPAYFRGFAQEVKEAADHAAREAGTPAAGRTEFKPSLAERPWRRFVRHFTVPYAVMQRTHDRLLARTRLLSITAWAQHSVALRGKAPVDLSGLPPSVTTDPYSGQPFAYRAEGAEFRVYSFGTDGRDDGGETDAQGNEPDLVLDPNA